MTKNNGIRCLQSNSNEELKLFKSLTLGSILIMGRKTVETLPELKGREIWCLTRDINLDVSKYKNDVVVFNDFYEVMRCIQTRYINKNIDYTAYVAGGVMLYNDIFSMYMDRIDKVYMSVMKNQYVCDTYVKFQRHMFTAREKKKYSDFTHYILEPTVSSECMYLNLLSDVYENGCLKKGRNGLTKSMFGKTISFDLQEGFPLLTTKKMFFRGVVEELLFFIRGETDSNKLEDKRINIWKGNTNREFLDSLGKLKRKNGVMGPMYGYQWRNYNASYDEEKVGPREKGLDQLGIVINQIRNDPDSRRILLTDYNPLQAGDGVLFPCHSIIIQFYVQDKYLDIFCYNRSSDLFHGLPFNIASTALFHILIAKITGKIARRFVLSLGDCHIYNSHFDVVKKQLDRIPFKFPQLKICKELKELSDIENLKYSDFSVIDYFAYPSLKAKMVS
jgi:dihydrofolate reductase/thymidylate synthase